MTEPNIEDKIEEILWDMISQDHHINHMADDLNSMDTAEDRQANIDETIKQIRPLIANQVREARIDERSQAQQYLHGLTITPESQHLFDVLSRNNHNRIATLNGVKK